MEPHITEVCTTCGGRVVPVVYGMPANDLFEAAERGELMLGGCSIEPISGSCPCGATVHVQRSGRHVIPSPGDGWQTLERRTSEPA